MGDVVGAFAAPHTPFFPAVAAGTDELAAELRRCYGKVREAFEAVQPEVAVFFLPDHFADNFETVPIFDIGVASASRGPVDDTDAEWQTVPIDAELGAGIHGRLVEDGFDVALCREPRLDHSSIVPLGFIAPQFDLPIVPIRISTFLRPLPSARRCFELGRSVRRAVEDLTDRRVITMATGNFSLDIGGSRMADDHYTGITDPRWVERVGELLGAADIETLLAEATREQIDRAGQEGGEILLWCALLGTFDPAPPKYLELQMRFGQAFAAWSSAGRSSPAGRTDQEN